MNEILVQNFLEIYNNKIILFGAGAIGHDMINLLRSLGIEPASVIDNDRNKRNQYVHGVLIVHFDDLQSILKDDNYIIIISTKREPEIYKQLSESALSIPRERVCSGWYVRYLISQNIGLLKEEYKNDCRLYFLIHRTLKYNCVLGQLYQTLYQCNSMSKVLLYTPGKVSTSTIMNTLQIYGVEHVLSHMFCYPDYIFHGQLQNEWNYALDRLKRGKIKIITAVREPIARDLSAFWHAFGSYDGAYLYSGLCRSSVQETFRDFSDIIISDEKNRIEKIGELCPFMFGEFKWLEEEFKKFTGINILDYPFDAEKGYCIIKKENIEVFVYKLERLSSIEAIMGSFVGIPNFRIHNANEAKNKEYAIEYEDFKKSFKITETYFKHYYRNNAFMNHFYSEKERMEFEKKWETHIEK